MVPKIGYSIPEAAAELNVPVEQVRAAVESRELPAKRAGDEVAIPSWELLTWAMAKGLPLP